MTSASGEQADRLFFIIDSHNAGARPDFVTAATHSTYISYHELADAHSSLAPSIICFASFPSVPLLEVFNRAYHRLIDNGLMLLPEPLVEHKEHCVELAVRLGFSLLSSNAEEQRYPAHAVFKKTKICRWKLGFAQETHTAAIQSLFLTVFKHPLSDALWHWKYAQHRGVALLAWKDNQLVGHYGAMQRDIFIANQPAKALQIGDVMIKNTERAVFTRTGLFFQVCATFLEHYIGEHNLYRLGYGFPTQRAMAIATKQGLYRQVDTMVEKQWPPLHTRASVFSRTQEFTRDNSLALRDTIDDLWQLMRASFSQSTLGVRDWQYIVHRYLQRPEKNYRIYLVKQRFGTKPLGLIVLAQEDTRCRLMDVVGDVQLFPKLIFHACRLCAQLSATQLYGWVTQSHQHLWPSDSSHSLDICIPTNAWSDRKKVIQPAPAWWLTAGDTDFC